MSGPGARRSIAGNVLRTGTALTVAFAVLAVGAGYWQVVEAQRLSTAPDNPAVIAIARRALRGPIVDRNDRWLARSSRDENGEALREYRDDALSHVLGYASRQFGTTGLERTYNAQLLGLSGSDPLDGLLSKFDPTPNEPLGLRTTLDLRLQRAAVRALGKDRGSVVMLDPSTGEILALASTPVYDANGIANPKTSADTFEALRTDDSDPLLPRATLGRYVPGSVFKIVTAAAGLDSGRIQPSTTFEEQPAAEEDGLLVSGFRIRDGHHPQTGDTALDLVGATEVSCNIWYALAGLETGGERLVAGAAEMGFGEPIPFRPAHGDQPRDRRRRRGARRIRGRRRARVGRIRAGGDVRDAAPDGARGLDGRERRRADGAPARERDHRYGARGDDGRSRGLAACDGRRRCTGDPGGDAGGRRGRPR